MKEFKILKKLHKLFTQESVPFNLEHTFHFQLLDVFKSIISLKDERIITCLGNWFPFCISL